MPVERKGAQPTGDVTVGGGHDLRAVGGVELQTVVPGGIVAGGHHDARRRRPRTDGEGHQRCRHRFVEVLDVDPCCGQDLDQLPTEVLGAVPGVVADHDERPGADPIRSPGGGVEDVGGDGRCRAAHHQPVHPVRPGPQRRAQPGGAELELRAEQLVELGGVRPFQDLVDLRAGRRVRVGGPPPSGPAEEHRRVLQGHATSTTSRSTARRVSVAAPPASSTSWWSTWACSPAARLVTRESPRTRAPR